MLIGVLSIIGNATSIMVLLGSKMRSSHANILIANQSFIDLLSGVFVLTLVIQPKLDRNYNGIKGWVSLIDYYKDIL